MFVFSIGDQVKRILSVFLKMLGLVVLLIGFVFLALLISLPLASLFDGMGMPIHWLLSIFVTSLLFYVVSRFLARGTSSVLDSKQPLVTEEEPF